MKNRDFPKLYAITDSRLMAAELLQLKAEAALEGGCRLIQYRDKSANSAKRAVEAFARGIAPEILPKRINIVSPGIIDTPMSPLEGTARDEYYKKATSDNLIKRAGTPDEVAKGIIFAIENEFITGTTIDVDGGCIIS